MGERRDDSQKGSESEDTMAMRSLSRSPDETHRLGMAVSRHLKPGDLVVLVGELGSGKSVFIRGLARGMGVKRKVQSPTFILIRDYPRHNFCHIDAYRLKGWEELVDLGVEEYLYGDRVCAIEWGDKVEEALPPDYLEIRITVLPPDEMSREIILVPHGRWRDRWSSIERELSH